jgi:hypothetical protein
MPEAGLKNGVYGLVPHAKYRVIRAITDFYGGQFAVGDVLTFVKRDFLPYHGGHTLTFEPRAIYFQDEANSDVLGSLDTYLEAL